MSKPMIRISETLALPLDWMLLSTVVYGVKGSGKTTLGSVIAEELAHHRQRFCVIDLKGDWWGLKSTADGAGEAIPVVVFGGDHADVPLEDGAGAHLGEVVVGLEQSCILDLEHLSKGKQVRFLCEFFLSVYHRNRAPLLLLLDEAQRYAPQKPIDPDAARCLGAVEDLVKLGRKHGLGVALFTQRGAGLNKEVSELCDMLVAFRTPGTIDQDRVKDWLGGNVPRAAREDLVGGDPPKIAGLPTGTAVFASAHPGLKLFGVHQVRRRETFDSSATPQIGHRRAEPKRLAKPDLEALRTKMAAAIERAAADDPKALRARIAELEREAKRHVCVPAETRTEVVHVPDEDLVDRVEKLGRELSAGLATLEEQILRGRRPPPAPPARSWVDHVAPRPRFSRTAAGERLPTKPTNGHTPADLPKGARDMLGALASIGGRERLSRTQVATLAGLAPTGGTFAKYLSVLKTAGLVEVNGDVLDLTPAGLKAAPPVTVHFGSSEVLDLWKAKLPAGARAMLDVLVDEFPRALGRDELGARSKIEPGGGTFAKYLSMLRTNGLAEAEGREVRATRTVAGGLS